MAFPIRTLQGIVLSREESGEGSLRMRVFSSDEGLVLVFKRLASKRASSSLPDLFDEVELRLSRPRSGTDSVSFVSEWRPLHRRPELARGQLRLERASSLSLLYQRNGAHLAEPAPAAELLANALDSLVEGYSPDAVYLKALYRFARVEGYPVKEDWWRSLPIEQRHFAAETLNVPLRELVQDECVIAEILESLRLWLNAETELLC
jgi:recombinational DNA repair protein (RecF pathway)